MKPVVRKSWSTGYWRICYGPAYHQNYYATWEQAYTDALLLASRSRHSGKSNAWR